MRKCLARFGKNKPAVCTNKIMHIRPKSHEPGTRAVTPHMAAHTKLPVFPMIWDEFDGLADKQKQLVSVLGVAKLEEHLRLHHAHIAGSAGKQTNDPAALRIKNARKMYRANPRCFLAPLTNLPKAACLNKCIRRSLSNILEWGISPETPQHDYPRLITVAANCRLFLQTLPANHSSTSQYSDKPTSKKEHGNITL